MIGDKIKYKGRSGYIVDERGSDTLIVLDGSPLPLTVADWELELSPDSDVIRSMCDLMCPDMENDYE